MLSSTQFKLTDNSLLAAGHVPESRFGVWFLGTETWAIHVLTRAVNDLERLIPQRSESYGVIVDLGCGWGRSFQLLHQRFRPRRLIGIDADPAMLAASAAEARARNIAVEFRLESASQLSLASESADMVFCHQTFHHLIDQEGAIREVFRVLKPGGVLLMAESTRRYIHSWMIRLLFRHAMDVQRTADEYLAMVRDAGFRVEPSAISYPFLWWSRSDLGILERVFGIAPPEKREETLVNLVAVRP
jgi:ubiquinone/menaquinone biosynthesis C-methylase UbiE